MTPALAILKAAWLAGLSIARATPNQHYATPAVLFEVRNGGAHRIEGRSEVEIEHALESHVVGFLDVVTAGPPTDQGAEAVDVAPFLGGALEKGAHGFRVGGIDPGEDQVLIVDVELALELLCLMGEQISDHQTMILADETANQSGAQPSGTARDDNCPTHDAFRGARSI